MMNKIYRIARKQSEEITGVLSAMRQGMRRTATGPSRGRQQADWRETMVYLTVMVVIMMASAQGEWVPINPSAAKSADDVRPQISWRAITDGIEVQVVVPGMFSKAVTGGDSLPYKAVKMSGCGSSPTGLGEPDLPCRSFLLEVPYGVDVSLAPVDQTVVSLGTGWQVYPLQPPQLIDEPSPPFQKSAAAYATNTWVPAQPLVMEAPGLMRGRRVVQVRFSPIQYNPATTELKALGAVRFNLQYAGTVDPAGETQKRRLASHVFEEIAKASILNYTPVASLSGTGTNVPPEGYLIIVLDDLYNAILPLAEWKHREGYATKVEKLSEIAALAGVSPADVEPAHIKGYIQSVYANGLDPSKTPTSYVLLVGPAVLVSGLLDIPANLCVYPSRSFYSDHPYACIQTPASCWPDVVVGRIPAYSSAQLDKIVAKTLAYEKGTSLPGQSVPYDPTYYGRALSASSMTWSSPDGYGPGFATAPAWLLHCAATDAVRPMEPHSVWVDETLPDPPGSRPLVWLNHEEFDNGAFEGWMAEVRPGSCGAGQQPVLDWINRTNGRTQSVGLVMYHGHGSQDGWMCPSAPPPGNMHNDGMPFVMYNMACSTGIFVSGSGYLVDTLRVASGGAVGCMGSASLGGFGFWGEKGLFSCIWPAIDDQASWQEGAPPRILEMGAALAAGKCCEIHHNYISADYDAHLINYFGDPELALRTRAPIALTVLHPLAAFITAPEQQALVPVQVLGENSLPVQNGRVAVSRPDSSVPPWVGVTDSAGCATLDIDLTAFGNGASGFYDLVVTAENAQPYETELEVTRALRIGSAASGAIAFTPGGHVAVPGTIATGQTIVTDISNPEFVWTNTSGVPVAKVDATGNLLLAGSKTIVADRSVPLPAPVGGYAFVVGPAGGGTGQPQAYVDRAGNLAARSVQEHWTGS